MNLNLEKYRKLIEFEIDTLPRKDTIITQDYINLDLKYLGVSHSHLRKLKLEEIYLLSREDQFEIFTYCFHTSQIYEVLSFVLMRLDEMSDDFLFSKKEDLLKLSYDIEHWNHSDLLSKIYAKLVESRRSFLKYLAEFNLNGSSWQKRLSLTSLIYYSTQRKNPLQFEIVAHQVKLLLDYDDYYVQKGLGWTLRELYNLYPEDTLNFIEVYVKYISPLAFQSAVEKLDDLEKNKLKEIRKSGVSNPNEFERKPAFERL